MTMFWMKHEKNAKLIRQHVLYSYVKI